VKVMIMRKLILPSPEQVGDLPCFPENTCGIHMPPGTNQLIRLIIFRE
jgi:hypothetical protein